MRHPYTVVDQVVQLVDEMAGGLEPGSPQRSPARRGTSNGNERGNTEQRRRRRQWLVETFRADTDVVVIELFHGPVLVPVLLGVEGAQPACRCYRCGVLLTVETVTADRIVPGIRGGTYARTNIRPACGKCNSATGGVLSGQRRREKAR